MQQAFPDAHQKKEVLLSYEQMPEFEVVKLSLTEPV